MNFFQHQDAARKRTAMLVALLIAAVASLILITVVSLGLFFNIAQINSTTVGAALNQELSPGDYIWQLLHTPFALWVALGVLSVVSAGSLYKLIELKRGGRAVAEALGGRLLAADSRDPLERKILNVVEEMAIASGNPVPAVYLLEDNSINAFAAGLSRHDAVIGVTRGCVNLLSRDELQGVVAHEFSHIHNGDMRLNMRLLAILHGILLIGLIGQFLARGSGGVRRRRDGRVALLGFALLAIGYGGTFFGNMIKAAISRQREFLADASAVQFTRNPGGITGALKKIGGWSQGSLIASAHAAEFSHFYFSQGLRSAFASFFSTHPPLDSRIKRIEPRWSGEFPLIAGALDEPNQHVSRFASEAPTPFQPLDDSVLEIIGEPKPVHIDLADRILEDIPASLQAAAHQAFSARALVYGLLLDPDKPDLRQQQIALLKQFAHPATFKELAAHMDSILSLHKNTRLPLLSLCIPALKNQSEAQYQVFKANLERLIQADASVSIFEWSLYRICTRNIEERAPHGNTGLEHHKSTTVFLLMAVSMAGNSREPLLALNKGLASLGWPLLVSMPSHTLRMDVLDKVLDQLERLRPLEKPKLLKALIAVITADNTVRTEEKELFRAIADTLDCPVPPLG